MITKIDASKRYHAKQDWLDTYHLFSFANYFDPENIHFGSLHVFNDDTIDAFSGFGDHGHENMEIVTIMHRGALTHRDSMGNHEVIRAGEVQRMSAGTGVVHAEKNLADESVHLYQIWILPNQQGLTPSYEQKDFSYPQKNRLVPVASDSSSGEVLKIHTDATIYLGDFEKDAAVEHSLAEGRGFFLYLKSGQISVNDILFNAGDQARIQHEHGLNIQAKTESSFVCIDVSMQG